ncbi:MAG: type II toxin-antitoxin system VapC family toxin [Gemmatimonadota bacterium]
MKLLLDINVLLDVLLDREPWSDAASRLLSAIDSNQAEGFVAPHTLPTIYYVVAQSQDRKTAKTAVTDLLRILDVATITRADFQRALELSTSDYEDAVQAAAALKIGADYLVTRNENDFRSVPVPMADAPTILALL